MLTRLLLQGGSMAQPVIRRSMALVAVSSLAWTLLLAQKAPPLQDLLKVAGDSLVQYARQLGTVAADEEFTQYDTASGRMGTPKRLNSVVVFYGQTDGSLATFRDLVGIDTVPVRPKDDRLVTLFKGPTASVSAAQSLTEDALKAYAGEMLHALDNPLQAHDLLRSENQPNWNYKVENMKTMDGAQVAVLKFTEQGKGHVIADAAAIGRYWIEPATGTIHQTELGFVMAGANIRATVRFTKDAQLGLFVPSELFEQVDGSSAGTGITNTYGNRQAMEGRAQYGGYRRVSAQR
jgi:hypothetical protein